MIKKAIKKKTVAKGIRKISDGNYEIAYYANGVRKYEIVECESNSIKELKAKRSSLMTAAKSIPNNPLALSKAVTFEEILVELERYCRVKGNTKKTISGYRKRYNRLFIEFPRANGLTITTPNELTKPFLIQYIAWYVDGYKSTVQIREHPSSEVKTIKIILGKLRQVGCLDKAVYEEIKGFISLTPNEDDTYPNILNADLKRMFDYMEKDDPSYHDFFKFLLTTGRRPMETAKILNTNVEWSGINAPVRINIKAATAKNRKKDQIDIHATRDVALKAIIINTHNRSNLLRSKNLFCNKDGRQISSSNQEVYIKRVSEKILGFKISAKYFRKRYATLCGQNRVPTKDAMTRSGHRDVEIFIKHYQQSTQDGIAAVIDAVGLE